MFIWIIGEFLQKEEITRDFAAYYRLYEKYKTDYRISEILEGVTGQKQYEIICRMAGRAQFEERFTLVELVMACLEQQIALFAQIDQRTVQLHENLIQLKAFFQGKTSVASMKEFLLSKRKAMEAKIKTELLLEKEKEQEEEQLEILQEYFLRIFAVFLQKPHL